MSQKQITILFSSAGRRVELIRCFRRSADALGISLKVIATDIQPALSSACAEADEVFTVPRCTDAQFIPEMEMLCKDEGVQLVIPTIDTELIALSQVRDVFESLGTYVAVSDIGVVRVARNKAATAELFHQHGIGAPRTMFLEEVLKPQGDPLEMPILLKPIDGSCSQGIFEINHAHHIPHDLPQKNYIAQELWRGREFTINAYVSKTGELLAVVPHERLEVRAGEVSKGITRSMPELEAEAHKIIKALPGLRGAFCYQAIVRKDGAHAVFEINARFGGGYPLIHEAGAPFAQWLLQEVLGETPKPIRTFKENLKMLRYDAAFFASD